MFAIVLKPGIGYCRAGGSMFFLDLEHDRYLRLSTRLQDIVENAISGNEIASEQYRALIDTGLFLPATGNVQTDIRDSTISAVPTSNLPQFMDRKVRSIRSWVIAPICLGWFHVAVKYLSLKHVLRIATGLSTRCTHSPAADVDIVMNTFTRCALVFPRKDQCLPDALALHTCLALLGHSSKIVFGIQPEPFQAHCWVQQGGVVLGQDCERVGNFHPILSVP